MIDHDLMPEDRDELGNLSALYEQLESYSVSEPDSAQLLSKLQPLLLERREETQSASVLVSKHIGVEAWFRLAWMQTRVLEAPFWWSSILLIALGLFSR